MQSYLGRLVIYVAMVVAGAIALLVAAALALGLMIKAEAHSWYDPECCNGNDCAPVDNEAIAETPNGYKVPTGETIPYSDKRVRESIDGNYHWCHIGGTTYCIYRPSRGM